MAKVSIVIPCYNVENYLKECLDSVINQTLNDIEIICINDGSTDSTGTMLNEYAEIDKRIKVIHKENGGYGSAMNVGLEKATGEYIGIVEPDDYIAPKMYEDLYQIAKEFDSDIVKSGFYDNLQSKEEKRILKVEWKDYIPEDRSFTIKEYPYFLYYHPSIWSCIYKKEFLDKHNIKFIEAPGAGWTDNPFQVQTMCLAERINYTSKAYYYWRRIHYYESDDLKDYILPFKRSDEIHQWLNENNINDESILIQLFRRELAYINIVLGMQKISDKNDCYNQINKMLSRCPKGFSCSTDIREDEIKTYLSVKQNPKIVRFKLLFERYRKNFISIRWNKKQKRVILLGKTILRRR